MLKIKYHDNYLQDLQVLWVLPNVIPLFESCSNKAFQNQICILSMGILTTIAKKGKTTQYQKPFYNTEMNVVKCFQNLWMKRQNCKDTSYTQFVS